MELREIKTTADVERYTAWLNAIAPQNVWQTVQWKAYSEAKGEDVRMFFVLVNEVVVASALCTISKTSGGYSTWTIPRGPVWHSTEAAEMLMHYIVTEAKRTKCIQLYFSPEQAGLHIQSAVQSKRLVFPEATVLLNIEPTLDEIKAQAKPKARYNATVASKQNVTIVHSTDASAFADLHNATAKRNTFTKPQRSQYQNFLTTLPGSFLLYAHVPNTPAPIAGLIGVIQGNTGIYYYGASNYEHRHCMAPYALQWAAIEHCKAQGALFYDFFGIAPAHALKHPWAGITDFKTKFGGTYTEYPPEQTIIFKPITQKLLHVKRRLLG